MPRGVKKTSPWVQVPALKGPMMCALCGRQAIKFSGTRIRMYGWCTSSQKRCSAVARHCAGPYLQEHKIKAVLRNMLGEEDER
jgi:hypothetical protein